MKYYARSAKNGDRQSYRDHVLGVMSYATKFVNQFLTYVKVDKDYLNIVEKAAEYHDLGKLVEANQKVLSGEETSSHLPIDHRDAGVQYLKSYCNFKHASLLVYAHHLPGLPDVPSEDVLQVGYCLDRQARIDSEQHLNTYLQIHKNELSHEERLMKAQNRRLTALEYRMLLSCLVDADYLDASNGSIEVPPTRWGERLESLDTYVSSLSNSSSNTTSRNRLRDVVYKHCRTDMVEESILYCDSPVGTGKTTAVMAQMLKKAVEGNLRHIFVILPYTSIITQTVDTLRRALVLEGEDESEIVVEHHHQADFESSKLRHLSTNWKAPIIVTTSVQFFETLSSNRPSKLRKIHELIGSAIIIDEAHSALPQQFLYPSWNWLVQLSDQWGCSVCLCSATISKFWEQKPFCAKQTIQVPNLITDKLHKELNGFEAKRLKKGCFKSFDSVSEFYGFIKQFQGSRLIVVDTVQSAAYLAKYLKTQGEDVLHLSKALMTSGKERILIEIKRRLLEEPSRHWILVATSIVECGVDFSFQHGFSELRSIQSYYQVAGRVNRNHEFKDSSFYGFTILDDNLTSNPKMKFSKISLKNIIEKGVEDKDITDIVSQCFSSEMKLKDKFHEDIWGSERSLCFAEVADKYHLIDEESITVLADVALIQRHLNSRKISWKELQKGSVQMSASTAKKLKLEEGELPILTEGLYDDFLGYMKTIV